MSIESRRHQYGTVFGHWKIKESLGKGSGGKSVVFRLEHAELEGVESALKVVSLIEETGTLQELSPQRRLEYERGRDEYSRWANQEVLLMNQLQGNTYIVDYLDHTFADWSDTSGFGRDMLIRMERLSDLRGNLRKGVRYNRSEIIKIGLHICNALILCHGKGIIHRDIKPGNIFVNKDGNYKLGDFGISKIIDSSASFMASTGIGTPQYWAPEQTSGQYDNRVDIYSLGLVLYELSNGNRLPFATSGYVRESEVHRRLMGEALPAPCDADAALANVILRACAFLPEHRYPTAEAFRDALAALEQNPPVGGWAAIGDDRTVSAVGYATPARDAYPTPQSYATPVPQSYATPVGQNQIPPQPAGQWAYPNPNSGNPQPRKKNGLGVLIGILAILLALLLGGMAWWLVSNLDDRNKDSGKAEATETEAEDEKTQQTEPVELAEVVISDGDSLCVASTYASAGYFCYHIPQVDLKDGRGAEISGLMAGELQGILDTYVVGEEIPSISCMYYSWGRRENTVSVLVKTQMTNYDWTDYYIYHVSAKSGKILDDSYIITACDLTGAEFRDLLETEVQAYYNDRKTQIVESVGEDGLKELMAKSLTEENLAAARPYIGENGDLCAVVKIHWFAGGDVYPVLLNLSGTGDAKDPECVVAHDPAETIKDMLAQAKVGDRITFGSYEQDNNRSNGQEAITWRVLAKEDGRLLVVSEYGLENLQYHHSYSAVTWETSYLRSWMNSSFYNTAFTELEKTLIPLVTVKAEQNPQYSNPPGNDTQDYVFALSTSEAERYFASDWERKCEPTAFAMSTGRVFLDSVYHDYAWWWLRNVGELKQDACCVNSDGRIDYKDGRVNSTSGVVRPAMWIEFD